MMNSPKHILKTQSFTIPFLEDIFKRTDRIKNCEGERLRTLEGKTICTFFYEESTRTRLSFEAAAFKLGANVISTTNARQFSSVSKGETLEDTIRVLHSYSDCIVLRYHEDGGAERAAHVSRVPIINAGDGSGQHPTQSLLDLYTIKDELGYIPGLKIALVGDLKHGRTVHSLAYLLGKYADITLYFVSPKELQMPQDILDYLDRRQIKYKVLNTMEALYESNVVYQTRIQKERFVSKEEYEFTKDKFIITAELAKNMLPGSIILHPLPRINELSNLCDTNPRAKYFKQAENGLWVRCAILEYLLT